MTKPAQSKKFRRLTLSHVDRPNGRGYFTRYKGKQKWFGYVSEDEANRLLAAFENEILNPPAEQPAAPAQPVSAVIDAGKTYPPISNYVYGQFIEHIANIIASMREQAEALGLRGNL